jgi:hypothetical protein
MVEAWVKARVVRKYGGELRDGTGGRTGSGMERDRKETRTREQQQERWSAKRQTIPAQGEQTLSHAHHQGPESGTREQRWKVDEEWRRTDLI